LLKFGMNKKIIVVVLIIMLGVVAMYFLGQKPFTKEEVNKPVAKTEESFLIEDFPIDKVPLYKLEKVSSSKIFVNTDPKNSSSFGDINFAYYNVVLYSTASQEEFLNYYKSLFESEIREEYSSPDMVKGIIGEYKVTAAHYGDDTGYLQVHLKDYQDERIDKYFEKYPNLLELSDYFVEHEKSFGLLNQKGGEEEYTKYFTVLDSGDQNNDGKDDVDEFLEIENKYKELYSNMSGYEYNEKTGLMKWTKDEYEVNVSISRSHGRIYLMIRRNFDNE